MQKFLDRSRIGVRSVVVVHVQVLLGVFFSNCVGVESLTGHKDNDFWNFDGQQEQRLTIPLIPEQNILA